MSKAKKNPSRTVRNSNSKDSMNSTTAYNNLQTRQQRFVDALASLFGKGDGNYNYTRTSIIRASDKCGMSNPPVWVVNVQSRRAGRGLYNVPECAACAAAHDGSGSTKPAAQSRAKAVAAATTEAEKPATVAALVTEVQRSFIPTKNPIYVPWGHFDTLRSIIKSKVFYPAWVNGESGNGKTLMIEQICAAEGREFFRVNITEETDEDDLLGGFRLVNGDTVWQDGPVVEAMNRGAVLLLDELDLGSFKTMCLQPVLEGKGVFLKKIGKFIKPHAGFTVFATANTKGKGSDDGRFAGTRVQNEALLERFKITVDQPYPPVATEQKIIDKVFDALNVDSEVAKPLSSTLARWSESVRRARDEGAIEEIVTTRRLVAIAEGFVIFGDIKQALTLGLSRFDGETRDALLDFYSKLAPETEKKDEAPAPAAADTSDCPF
jgi:MoxR-like ATPase